MKIRIVFKQRAVNSNKQTKPIFGVMKSYNTFGASKTGWLKLLHRFIYQREMRLITTYCSFSVRGFFLYFLP